jgi:hypothetical protein
MAQPNPSRQEVRVTVSVGPPDNIFGPEEVAIIRDVAQMDSLQLQEAIETAVSRAMDVRDTGEAR